MRLFIITLIVLFAFKATPQIITNVDQLVYDHIGVPIRVGGGFGYPWGAHEGYLHGLPQSWDWFEGARPGAWMNNDTNQSILAWGQIYEWAGESPLTNVRFQIRNHRMYIFTDGQWILADGASNQIECEEWTEDYNKIGVASGRDETNNGGGTSFILPPNRILHWWDNKWPRYTLPSNFEAVFAICEIRLIPNTDTNVSLNEAKYLAGVSEDYYPNATYIGSGPFPSLSISRQKFITSEWKTFTSYISGQVPLTELEYSTEILSRPLPPFVSNSTGINSLENICKTNVYPVPSKKQIIIEGPIIEKYMIIELYNTSGQKLFKRELTDNKTTIDISYLKNGIYLIKLMNAKEFIVKKIIVE